MQQVLWQSTVCAHRWARSENNAPCQSRSRTDTDNLQSVNCLKSSDTTAWLWQCTNVCDRVAHQRIRRMRTVSNSTRWPASEGPIHSSQDILVGQQQLSPHPNICVGQNSGCMGGNICEQRHQIVSPAADSREALPNVFSNTIPCHVSSASISVYRPPKPLLNISCPCFLSFY